MNVKDIHEGKLYIRIIDTTIRKYEQPYTIYKHKNTTRVLHCTSVTLSLGKHYREGYIFKAGYKDVENWNQGVYDENFIFHNSNNIEPYSGTYTKELVSGDKLFYYSTFMQRGMYSIRNHEISTVQELCLYREQDLLRIRGLGMNSIRNIREFMKTVDNELKS